MALIQHLLLRNAEKLIIFLSKYPVLVLFKRDLLHREYIQHVQGQITKLFPLTNLNKYLHYGTSGTEVYLYINISENKGSEKL